MRSTRAISIVAISAFLATSCRSAAPLQEPLFSNKTSTQTERDEGHNLNMSLSAYDKAIEEFERNKSLVNDDYIFITVATAYLLRYVDSGEKLRDMKDLELALEYSNKAIALNGSNAKYYGARGEVYREFGKTKTDAAEHKTYLNKALEDFSHCVQLSTNSDLSAMCHRGKARVFDLLGDAQTSTIERNAILGTESQK